MNEATPKGVTDANANLSEAARRRGLITLLIDVFCMYTGFFMVVPLISVHYVDGLGWAAAAIGIVLGVRQLTQQGLTLFGGVLADQMGTKTLICAGLVVRIIGFVLLAWASTFSLLLLACLLAAIGGALFESPRAATIAALTTPENRQRFYSLSGAIGGVGMAAGPLLGAMLLHYNFSIVALVGAAFFTLNLIQTLIMLPQVRVAASGQRLTHGLGLVMGDKRFLVFTSLLMGYWFMWVQLSISLPLVSQKLTGTSDGVGIIYAVNSVMMIFLQYPLVRMLGRRYDQMVLLIAGVVLMSVGLASVSLAVGLTSLIASVVVFSLGALIVSPTQQTVMASMASPASLGTYFGIGSLALAFGGGLGNFSGGVLYGWGQQHSMPALPWIVFSVVGMASAIGLWMLYRQQQRVTSLDVALESAQPAQASS